MDKQRKLALGALAVTAAFAFWPDSTPPVAAASAREAATASAPAARIALPARDAMPEFERDPFLAQTAKPAKSAAPVAAAAPAAPINPYRFAGELRTNGATQRFLARGDDVFEAKAGDALDDGYVVESVSAAGIVLLHRPSGQRQTLAAGAPALEDPAYGRVVQVAQAGSAQSAQAPLAELSQRLDAMTGNLPAGFFLNVGSPERQGAQTAR